jgi:transposase-like protein
VTRCLRIARESGRPIAAVAGDLGIHHETLRLRVRQDEANDGTRSHRPATAEREEFTSLRREVCDLRRASVHAESGGVCSRPRAAQRRDGAPRRAPAGRHHLRAHLAGWNYLELELPRFRGQVSASIASPS